METKSYIKNNIINNKCIINNTSTNNQNPPKKKPKKKKSYKQLISSIVGDKKPTNDQDKSHIIKNTGGGIFEKLQKI